MRFSCRLSALERCFVLKIYYQNMVALRLFHSTSIQKIDKKGRVSVPAAIRAVIEEKEKDRAVVFAPSFHGLSCIEGYGSSRIEEIALALDGLNPLSREYDAFTATMLAQIRVVPFDSEGRIVLHEDIIEIAKLDKEVVFAGMGKKFQIWNPENYSNHMQEMRKIARENPALMPWSK